MSEVKSTRGRKKKAETKSYKMQFLIEESIKDKLERQAEDMGLELKDYVRWILTQRAKNIEVRTQIVTGPTAQVAAAPVTDNDTTEGTVVTGFVAQPKVHEVQGNQSTKIEKEEGPKLMQNSRFGAR